MTEPTVTYVLALVAHATRLPVPRSVPRLPQATKPSLIPVRPGWWLVVCDVPLRVYGADGLQQRMGDLEWIATVAVAHEGVIEAFLKADAVLPLKLFTIFSSPSRASAHFLERESSLVPVVARVAGAEEWGVRVAMRAPTLRVAAPVVEAATGAGYLRGKKAQYQSAAQRQARVQSLASDLFASLSSLSSAARERAAEASQGSLVLDAAFLVPRSGGARLKAAAARFAQALKPEGGDVVVTGPWPPYSFVQE